MHGFGKGAGEIADGNGRGGTMLGHQIHQRGADDDTIGAGGGNGGGLFRRAHAKAHGHRDGAGGL